MSRAKPLAREVVALIKMDLQQGIKQKDIATKHGIQASMVSKIKKGNAYADVQIDNQGNLVGTGEHKEPEPTDYIVPMAEGEDKPETLTEDESTAYRVQFIESYFKKKMKENPYDADAIYSHYEPSGKISMRFIGGLWNSKKSLFNFEWDDFISAVMFSVTCAVMKFEPAQPFDWLNVCIDETAECNKLHAYINQAIRADLDAYANQINDSIKVERNGVIGWAKPNRISLNEVIENDGAETQMIEAVDLSYWQVKKHYTGSHFMDWFGKNQKELLTDGQKIFLSRMKFFQREQGDSYTVPYSQLPDDVKPYSQVAIGHNTRRIRERVESAYSKINPMTLRQLKHQKEKDFWLSFIHLVDDEQDDEQGRLSRWLKNNRNSTNISDMCWQLSADEVIGLRKELVPIKVLYRVVEFAHARIKHLDKLISKDKKIVAFPRVEREEVVPEEGARMVILPSGNFELINGGLADG